MKAKHYYNFLFREDASSFILWQNYLELSIDFEWNKVIHFKFKEIKDNKIKEFNFKLLH